jgi:hypothetical protein
MTTGLIEVIYQTFHGRVRLGCNCMTCCQKSFVLLLWGELPKQSCSLDPKSDDPDHSNPCIGFERPRGFLSGHVSLPQSYASPEPGVGA